MHMCSASITTATPCCVSCSCIHWPTCVGCRHPPRGVAQALVGEVGPERDEQVACGALGRRQVDRRGGGHGPEAANAWLGAHPATASSPTAQRRSSGWCTRRPTVRPLPL